jgi:hypothetical protein
VIRVAAAFIAGRWFPLKIAAQLKRRRGARDLGGPVSLDYYDRAPLPFTGTINNVNARYTS